MTGVAFGKRLMRCLLTIRSHKCRRWSLMTFMTTLFLASCFACARVAGFGRVVCEGLSCHFHAGQLFEYLYEVFPWIDFATAATLDQ